MQPAAQLHARGTATSRCTWRTPPSSSPLGSADLGPQSDRRDPVALGHAPREAVAVLELRAGTRRQGHRADRPRDSPVAQEADFTFTNFAEDDTSSESFYLQSLVIALAMLNRLGRFDGFDAARAELETAARAAARREARLRAARPRLAESIQDEPSTSSPAPVRAGPRPGTTARASSRRCSGSAPGRSTPPTSSTARSSWSSQESASCCSRARTRRGPWPSGSSVACRR